MFTGYKIKQVNTKITLVYNYIYIFTMGMDRTMYYKPSSTFFKIIGVKDRVVD